MPEPLRFVVIKAPGLAAGNSEPPAAGSDPRRMRNADGGNATSFDASTLQVTEDEIEPDKVGLVRRDPEVLGVALSMPISLIEPLDASGDTVETPPQTAWGIQAVGAESFGAEAGRRVTVAVLDTGIKTDHPAFDGIRLEHGDNLRNFTNEANVDLHGHGTHCAGTIFGRDVDGTRIGIARGVTNVLIGKVIGKGGGSTESVFQGLTWAISRGAHVISMSLGLDFVGFQERLEAAGYDRRHAASLALAGYRGNIRLFDTVSRMLDQSDGTIKGSIVAAAAGNESRRPDYAITVSPPAAGEKFLSVGALQRGAANGNYAVAPFSNEEVKFAAPGAAILSASLGGGLAALSGTSMAAPHVAGVAALWADAELQAGGRFSAQEIIEKMRGAADPLPHLGKADVGWGMPMAPKPMPRRMRTI